MVKFRDFRISEKKLRKCYSRKCYKQRAGNQNGFKTTVETTRQWSKCLQISEENALKLLILYPATLPMQGKIKTYLYMKGIKKENLGSKKKKVQHRAETKYITQDDGKGKPTA